MKKARLSKKNHKEQIHLMDQRSVVRAEAQILKNSDVSNALERAVDQVVTSVSLKSQKEKPGELPVGTRQKKLFRKVMLLLI